jgi:hypothetical protein
MSDPEALADLTPEQRAAWDAWIAEPRVGAFLEDVIARCRAQAEANRSNPEFMVFGSTPPEEPNDDASTIAIP